MGKRLTLKYSRTAVRQVLLLLAMPLLIVGTSYALFSQTLTVDGDGELPQYVSNNYTVWTYTKTATLAAGIYTYKLNPFVIKNNGVTSITAWKVMFTVPADTTAITCPTTVTCSINNTTHVVTITRTVTIAKGASSTINNTSNSIRFTTATANYIPQNVDVSATYSTAYATITGLTVVATAGTKSGGAFPLTVTITNNSGQPISGWKVTVPTTKTCTSTVPSGVTYTCTTTVLTYTGAAVAIAAGAQYQFNTTVTTTMTTWTTTGAAVTGKA